jgi:hypothetical protein
MRLLVLVCRGVARVLSGCGGLRRGLLLVVQRSEGHASRSSCGAGGGRSTRDAR